MKISIVTAAYNSASTIESTIKSVLGQDFADWEHIVVDGDSTDDTAAIVERYREQYAGRLKFVSERDRGIYDAMNKGIALSTGDVVGLLNSDDFYSSPDVLSAVANAFRDERELDAVYGDVVYVAPDDLAKTVRHYSSAGFRRWKMVMGFMPAHPSFYCRREVYSVHGDFDISFRVAADFEHLLRVLYRSRVKTTYLPMTFVTMRTGGASSSGLASHRAIYRDHRRAYRKNRVTSGLWLDWLRYPCRVASLIGFKLRNK